jgi:methylated-DNA-[protein]-cysteine S-methyltransferase
MVPSHGRWTRVPNMPRAVGQAMATNPIPLIIPCHRVLAAGGKIGGFSAPGGSTSKARMLELEGVAVAVAPVQHGFDF